MRKLLKRLGRVWKMFEPGARFCKKKIKNKSRVWSQMLMKLNRGRKKLVRKSGRKEKG